MRCPNCGAELTDDSVFCSYCGSRMESRRQNESNKENPPHSGFSSASTGEYHYEKSAQTSTGKNRYKKSAQTSTGKYQYEKSTQASSGKKPKGKASTAWGKLSLYYKVVLIAIVVVALLLLVAALSGRVLAAVIALVQLALLVVAVLMKREIIKTPQKWLHFIPFVAAILLLFPYGKIFSMYVTGAEKIVWSDLELSDLVPAPESLYGKVILDSDSYLTVYVYRTTEDQYKTYVEDCKEFGYSIDSEKWNNTYEAYDGNGNELSLIYYSRDKSIRISVEIAREYGDLRWPTSGMAAMLPVPESTKGEIVANDDSEFYAYVSETPIEKYEEYVTACAEMGFIKEVINGEQSYSAYNEDGYWISVSYEGNSLICIILEEPEYEVSIGVECEENALFSKYDVKVYVDGIYEGKIEQGDSKTFTAYLTKGTHEIVFEDEDDDDISGSTDIEIQGEDTFEYRISCTSTDINVTSLNYKESGESIDTEDTEISSAGGENESESPASSEETENVTTEDDLASFGESGYEVTIDIECVENWFFSKYDVDIYIDGIFLGTVEHGTNESYAINLEEGIYEIVFVDAEDDGVTGSADMNVQGNDSFEYEIYCTSISVNVETIGDTEEKESNSSNESGIDKGSTEKASESESSSGTDEAETLYYSTNTKDTVLNGNSGVYAYSSDVGDFDIYWIIDFDEGYVYWFMYSATGTDSTTCDKVKIDSGDLNTGLILVYHEADYTWSQTLTFTFPGLSAENITLEDSVGDKYNYYATDLDKALAIRDERIMFEY